MRLFSKQIDDSFYVAAMKELADKKPDAGAFARAFAQSGGDEAATRALYVQLRAEQLERAHRDFLRNQSMEKRQRENEAVARQLRERQAALAAEARALETFKAEYPSAQVLEAKRFNYYLKRFKEGENIQAEIEAEVAKQRGVNRMMLLVFLSIVTIGLFLIATLKK